MPLLTICKFFLFKLACAFLILPSASSQCIIAHRGFAGIAPDNSFVSIDTAIASNACAVEIDVRMTKDSILVLMHNKRINRTTDGKGRLKDLSFNALSKFSIIEGNENHIIPTLDSVLYHINGLSRLIIELKHGHEGAEMMLAQLIKKHHAYEWCIVQSFCDNILLTLHAYDKNIELHKLLLFKSRFFPVIVDRTLRFKSIKDYDYISTFAIKHHFAGKRLIRHFQNNGKKVNVWTVKKERHFNKFQNRGADGVISDFPF